MARKKAVTEEQKFEEIIESIDAGKKNSEKSEGLDGNVPEELPENRNDSPTNRALKLEICDQIEKINNRYYLLIIKKYIDNLGG